MALNKDILGTALYNAELIFNETFIDPVDMEAARLEFWKKVADQIISHFKANIEINIPAAGISVTDESSTWPAAGASTTGTIT